MATVRKRRLRRHVLLFDRPQHNLTLDGGISRRERRCVRQFSLEDMMRPRQLCLLALVVLAGCVPAPADELEASKELVRQFAATINAADWDAFDTLLTEDFRRHSQATTAAPEIASREDFKRLQQMYLLSFPDQHVTIRMLIAEGDKVAAYTTYAGTNTGPLGDVSATGRSAELVNIGIFRIERDKIAELWVEWDNLAMQTQLGLYPPAGPSRRP